MGGLEGPPKPPIWRPGAFGASRLRRDAPLEHDSVPWNTIRSRALIVVRAPWARYRKTMPDDGRPIGGCDPAVLAEWVTDARTRTIELVHDLSDELLGPRLSIVNPLRWEIGHVAWFQEHWILRHLGRQPPVLKQGDALYDSARVAHDTRWD